MHITNAFIFLGIMLSLYKSSSRLGRQGGSTRDEQERQRQRREGCSTSINNQSINQPHHFCDLEL